METEEVKTSRTPLNRQFRSRGRGRVCVCTSYQAEHEPRGPKHAAALARLDQFEVVFIDSVVAGTPKRSVKSLEGLPNLEWRSHEFASRSTRPFRLLWDRLKRVWARWLFALGGPPIAGALSTRAWGLERLLVSVGAEVYLGHNIDTLLPVVRAANRQAALPMFDSMEFHSDMGDDQTALERRLIRAIERRALPECALVLASSDLVADALMRDYGIMRPLPLYNMPPIEAELPAKPATGLALYWRNSVVNIGQRGLEEALVALSRLPGDVTLHLQGRLPVDGGKGLRARIAALGLSHRVFLHEPFAPENAIKEAGRYHVGLCLERRACRNHELTVSNKIFDYHMAGLAVVASDLPGLSSVLKRSGGGLLFEPGSADDLTSKLMLLYQNKALRLSLASAAREFALREGNSEVEMKKFCARFLEVCHEQWKRHPA